jgi:hypothetical protein
VGGRDECAVVAEGRKVSIIPDECRSQPGTLIGVGPGLYVLPSLPNSRTS